jgi:hypothetical protein
MTTKCKRSRKRNIKGFREDKPKYLSSATLSIHKKVTKAKKYMQKRCAKEFATPNDKRAPGPSIRDGLPHDQEEKAK